ILAHVTHDEFPVTVVNRRRLPAQLSGDLAVRQLANVLKQEGILFRSKPTLLRRFHHAFTPHAAHPSAQTTRCALPRARRCTTRRGRWSLGPKSGSRQNPVRSLRC